MAGAPELVSSPDCQSCVAQAIRAFEDGEITAEEAVAEVQRLTGMILDDQTLHEYWSAESLESLARRLCTEPIQDWATLSDEDALALIKQILDDMGDDALLARNGDTLERRYRKTTGTVMDLIFIESLTAANEILAQLKKDAVIRL
ncbi:MAG: hypothetical protein AAF624_09130 [Bacteroidota bacterium]